MAWHGPGVAARLGFGQGKGGQGLAPGQGRQIPVFLGVGAVEQQGIGPQEAGGIGGGHAHAALGQGLQDQAVLQAPQFQAAIGLGDDGAAEIGLGQVGQDVPGKDLFLVQLRPDGFDAFLGDLAGQILEHLLLFGEQIIHGPLLRRFRDHQPALVKPAMRDRHGGADAAHCTWGRWTADGGVRRIMGASHVLFRDGFLSFG